MPLPAKASSAMPGMAIRNWLVRSIRSWAMAGILGEAGCFAAGASASGDTAGMEKKFARALVWFRRDLRADDQAALYRALTQARQVFCAFVLDTDILDALPRADRRVEFILDALRVLDEDLRAQRPGAGLIVRHGCAADELPRLAAELGVQAVFCNH